jgi:hypothetical protein
VQAPAPARLIEGGLPAEVTFAQVLVSKYADHLCRSIARPRTTPAGALTWIARRRLGRPCRLAPAPAA